MLMIDNIEFSMTTKFNQKRSSLLGTLWLPQSKDWKRIRLLQTAMQSHPPCSDLLSTCETQTNWTFKSFKNKQIQPFKPTNQLQQKLTSSLASSGIGRFEKPQPARHFQTKPSSNSSEFSRVSVDRPS